MVHFLGFSVGALTWLIGRKGFWPT